MAKNNWSNMNADLQKRIIFIQKLGPDTTRQSLMDYFSDYPIERCSVPLNAAGENRRHAIITFQNEQSVDAVMSQSFHRIDGTVVFIYRSSRRKQSLKDTDGIQQLIVSGMRNQSLIESDIRDYFSYYGEICNISQMKNDDTIWLIDLNSYDSVDKIILDAPHCIGRIDVNVKRGDRNVLSRLSSPQESMLITDNNDRSGVISKESNLKQVTINKQTSSRNLLPQRYRIHITNLPANIDAEILSKNFYWNIYDIVMDSSFDDRASSRQCWLKNPEGETEVDKFIEHWNGKAFGESIIQCEKEEDEFELCNKFQYGGCDKTNGYCHWEHVPCTAQGNCASTCPYGHEPGTKPERYSPIGPVATSARYRIKLTGFRTTLTPQEYTQLFRSNFYYVDRNNNHVLYLAKIKTMKFAKQLMKKWHDQEIDGQRIKCQLEFHPRFNRARSPTASVDGKSKHHYSFSRSLDTRSLHSSQGTSDLEDIDNITSTSSENREMDRDSRICRVFPSITDRLLNDVLANEWEVTNKASNSDGKVLLIRSKVDEKRLAVIKIYSNQSLDDINREINAMKDLKDVKGVSQLIEQGVNHDNLWMIMERAPGCSLKEFIEEKCQGVLEMSTAIKLTLNLIGIIQQMHNKGIFHQNLSPENIMIKPDLKSSISRAQLTVLNFSHAVIVSNRTYTPVKSSTQKWYYAPQIDDQRLSSTVDSSASCAILFWLLTQIEPSYNNDDLLHVQAHDKLDDMIESTVKFTNIDRHIPLEEQLKRYLMDTFDRAFGYPHYHPWPINDLKCRLELILRLLIPSEPQLNTIDGIFEELISIADWLPTPPITFYGAQRDAFEKAAEAFGQAKKYFLENGKNQYRWSDGRCTWVHNSMNECRNDDVLIYCSFRGETSTSYSVIITCLARFNEKERMMALFISSNVNGKTIQVPIGQYSTVQDYTLTVQKNFVIELTNILLAIYNEQKP